MSRLRTNPSPGLFREIPLAPQTPHDKTAAAAKLIIETEATKRADRSAALKAARLARDALAKPAKQPAR
ncbi:hypothetical protein C8J30_1245 [Rhodobacter viridis]|uniref:Uncharacterized protein n=1 Tax=Rhodobacter viridis TaxID=1054202 RepID=A0A318TQV1_9RHOB|nr:hypothetical protein [Rhodobacter viridis]PYF06723.1 hypothetical protein C8J30_1245 [Rhodobacter viridis]